MTENMGDLNREFDQPTKEHLKKEQIQKKHLEFSGKSRNCCVCIVDIVGSTKLVSEIPMSKTSVFYSTFLNSMVDVVEQNGGKIVKSIGDALLFYFDDSVAEGYPKNALRCGLDMIASRDKVNSVLRDESLPPINYRVSSDFGTVMVGYSSLSAAEDIFGPTVNISSKINSLGHPNGMVIGNNFYLIAKSLHGFQFDEIKHNPFTGLKNNYRIFDVKENND